VRTVGFPTERLVDDTTTGPSPTRVRLLEAAADLFGTKGYAKTTTRELAATAGIQGASMYHHVHGKDELLEDLCVESLTHLADAVSRAIEDSAEPIDRLRAAIAAHVSTTVADRNKHATMLTELRSLPEESRGRVVGLRDAYEMHLAELMADGQANGQLRDDISARLLTLALLNLLNWTIFWFRQDGELSVDDLSGVLTSLFYDGAAAK
jgi:AcrR family transcriptional regulator